ncbi:MAG: COG4315 family predicted lipoprotein [Actinopolymorphaceae bacterium]
MRVRRSRQLRCLAGTAAVLLMAAACGGQADSSTTSQPKEAADPTSDALVAVRAVDGVGDVLTDPDGMTLYTADVEKGGTIACVDACADFWPPLTTDAAKVPTSIDGVTGEFDVLERPDQTTQVTLDGQPLYTFAEDRTPGSVQGDGFEDDFGGQHFVWKIVTSDGTAAGDGDAPADESGGGGGGDDGGGLPDYDY